MKKLIEELEEELNAMRNDMESLEERVGFKMAIDIVKAHNPWIVASKLPPRKVENGVEKNYSIFVLAKVAGENEIVKAFYQYNDMMWYTYEIWKNINVIKWTYLPEVVNET